MIIIGRLLAVPAQARYTRYNFKCDDVCHGLAAGRCFSPGSPVSSTNKTDCHDITVILLKVALSTITLTLINTVSRYVLLKVQSLHIV